MDNTFRPQRYVSDLGNELVRDFNRSQFATHPGAVGAAKETAIRNKIGDLLPGNIGVGSGFVIDSYGGTSRQCDLIIYEKDYALKFAINGDDVNAYYNCESVIAVGEVKSNAGSKEIRDTLEKIERISKLKRRIEESVRTRNYNSPLTIWNADSQKYDPINNPLDRIFTFMVCNEITIGSDTLCSIISEFRDRDVVPNFLLPIDGPFYLYSDSNSLTPYPTKNDKLCKVVSESNGFGSLISVLAEHFYKGRTVQLNDLGYFISNEERYTYQIL